MGNHSSPFVLLSELPWILEKDSGVVSVAFSRIFLLLDWSLPKVKRNQSMLLFNPELEEMDSCLFQEHLCKSECNKLGQNLNLFHQFHFPHWHLLYYLHIPLFPIHTSNTIVMEYKITCVAKRNRNCTIKKKETHSRFGTHSSKKFGQLNRIFLFFLLNSIPISIKHILFDGI